MKLLFIPFSVFGGLASGFLAKKIFEQAWGVVDSEEPPKPVFAVSGRVRYSESIKGFNSSTRKRA